MRPRAADAGIFPSSHAAISDAMRSGQPMALFPFIVVRGSMSVLIGVNPWRRDRIQRKGHEGRGRPGDCGRVGGCAMAGVMVGVNEISMPVA